MSTHSTHGMPEANAVILDALAGGFSNAEAAAQAGVTTRTVRRRLANTEFAAAEVARPRAMRCEEALEVLDQLTRRNRPTTS